MYEFITQLMGFIGLIMSVIAFQCKKHKNIMLYRTGNQVFFGLQYILMGEYTGTAMNAFGTVRNLVFARLVEKGKSTRAAQIIFSLVFVISGIITYQAPINIGAIASKVITTFAYGMKNTTLLRCFTLPTNICWLAYDIYCGSIAGVICEVFSIVSLVSAIIRLDIYPALKKSAH